MSPSMPGRRHRIEAAVHTMEALGKPCRPPHRDADDTRTLLHNFRCRLPHFLQVWGLKFELKPVIKQ
jgi:hypothetical protein